MGRGRIAGEVRILTRHTQDDSGTGPRVARRWWLRRSLASRASHVSSPSGRRPAGGRPRLWGGLTGRQWAYLAVGIFMLACLTVPGLAWLFSPRSGIPAFPGLPTLSGPVPQEGAAPSPGEVIPAAPGGTGPPAPEQIAPAAPVPGALGVPAENPSAGQRESAATGGGGAPAGPAADGTVGRRETGGQRARAPAPGELAWPLEGEVVAVYGFAYSEVHGDWRLHPGVDIAGAAGAGVACAGTGTVRSVSRDPLRGWVVEVDHGGDVVTAYLHLGRVGVGAGDRVRQGQLLGYLGQPGDGEPGAPHLHLEVRVNGASADPLAWLRPR